METTTSAATSGHLTLKSSKINLKSLPLDYKKTFYANANEHSWIKNIITEFHISDEHQENTEQLPSTEFKVTIERKENSVYGEHILVEGQLKSDFQTECVRCLDPVQEIIDTDFNLCFLTEDLAKEEEYEETLDLFVNDKEHELYFYSDNSIDLRDFIYEAIALNKNPFPLHDKDCKGLCQFCGENLNKINCVHTK